MQSWEACRAFSSDDPHLILMKVLILSDVLLNQQMLLLTNLVYTNCCY